MIPLIMKICMIAIGILLIVLALGTFFRKKIDEQATIIWCVMGLVFILTGSIPGLSEWSVLMAHPGYIGLLILMVIVFECLFYLTKQVSGLRKKNQELAMHVSLLNQENERILLELEKLTGKEKTEL